MNRLAFYTFIAAGVCSAATITDLCGTGQAACGGALLSTGSVDTHYTIISGPVTGATYVGAHPVWVANDSKSEWITPLGGVSQAPGGYYTYETTFTAEATSFVINGLWSADNAGYDIILNGKSLLNNQISGSGLFPYGTGPYGFDVLTPFTISSGFVVGANTLDFVVQNGNFGSDTLAPSGLRVEMNAITSTPEPATLGLTGVLLAFMGGSVVFRKRSTAAVSSK